MFIYPWQLLFQPWPHSQGHLISVLSSLNHLKTKIKMLLKVSFSVVSKSWWQSCTCSWPLLWSCAWFCFDHYPLPPKRLDQKRFLMGSKSWRWLSLLDPAVIPVLSYLCQLIRPRLKLSTMTNFLCVIMVRLGILMTVVNVMDIPMVIVMVMMMAMVRSECCPPFLTLFIQLKRNTTKAE